MARAENSITTAITAAMTTSSPTDATAAKSSWRKPVVEETACGCEINCYATSSGVRRAS
jgi:hypothetical protein